MSDIMLLRGRAVVPGLLRQEGVCRREGVFRRKRGNRLHLLHNEKDGKLHLKGKGKLICIIGNEKSVHSFVSTIRFVQKKYLHPNFTSSSELLRRYALQALTWGKASPNA